VIAADCAGQIQGASEAQVSPETQVSGKQSPKHA
jgi:hypothetical protein